MSMNHPEIFAIPVLMLADYYLTIIGARVKATSGYGEHMVTETYELNPKFRKEVDSQKWFSPRHLAYVIMIPAWLFLLDWLVSDSGVATELGWLVPLFWGFLASACLTVIGRHIMNLGVFRTLRRNRGFVAGRVELDHRYVQRISAYHAWPVILPLALVAIMVPSPLTLGIALGPLRLAIANLQWEAWYNRRLAKAATAEPLAPPQEEA